MTISRPRTGVSILLAAVCLATTVLALRHTGLNMSRIPLYAWSVLVASALWLLTLPVVLVTLAVVASGRSRA